MSTSKFLKRCVSGIMTLAGCFALVLGLFPLFASAAPFPLGCKVNETDGRIPKTGQIIITNTTGNAIAEGTMIDLTVQIRRDGSRPQLVKIRAYATIPNHDYINGGDTPLNAHSCTANISLVQPKTTFSNKKSPVIAK